MFRRSASEARALQPCAMHGRCMTRLVEPPVARAALCDAWPPFGAAPVLAFAQLLTSAPRDILPLAAALASQASVGEEKCLVLYCTPEYWHTGSPFLTMSQ